MTATLPTIPQLVEAKLRGVPPEGWVDVGGYLANAQFEVEGIGNIVVDTVLGQQVKECRFIFGFHGPASHCHLQFDVPADYVRIRSMHGLQIDWFILYGRNQSATGPVGICESAAITSCVPERAMEIPLRQTSRFR